MIVRGEVAGKGDGTGFGPDVDVASVTALHGKPPARVFRNVLLHGVFGPRGTHMLRGLLGFDAAFTRANCELFVAGRLQRFTAEIVVNTATGLTAWRPDLGWAPVLCASDDALTVQGRPGDEWELRATVVDRPPDRDWSLKKLAEGLVVPCPKADGEVIDCMPYVMEGERL